MDTISIAGNVRWGIIGCGDVTEIKSGPGFQKASGSALVAVMRRDGAKAADYAKRHNVSRWYDDADALIRDDEVDARLRRDAAGVAHALADHTCECAHRRRRVATGLLTSTNRNNRSFQRCA